MEKKFYRCEICGNLVGMIKEAGVPLECCGEPMVHLKPNTKDAAVEKHVPSIAIGGSTLRVQVGSTLHPMEEAHYIEWIAVTQGPKTQRVALQPGDEPKACFEIDPDGGEIVVYAYCNLHDLWEAVAN